MDRSTTTTNTERRRGLLERPDTPAQWFASLAGVFLLALGVLSLIISSDSWTASGGNQPQFIIWAVSGWTSILWIVMGGLGMLSAGRLDSARSYALFAGVVFAALAVWGFIDGTNVATLFAAGTTDNITHAIIAGLGLMTALMPRSTQRPGEERQDRTVAARRGSMAEAPRGRHLAGHR